MFCKVSPRKNDEKMDSFNSHWHNWSLFYYSQKVCNQKKTTKLEEGVKKELQLMLSLFVSISERSSRFPSWKRIHTRRMPFCTVPLESPSTWLVSSSPPLISKPLMKWHLGGLFQLWTIQFNFYPLMSFWQYASWVFTHTYVF